MLDVLLFAPVGLLVTASEELPKLVEKGRSRLDQPVRNARFLGKLAVTGAQSDLRRRLSRLGGPGDDPSATPERVRHGDAGGGSQPAAGRASSSGSPGSPGMPAAPGVRDATGAGDASGAGDATGLRDATGVRDATGSWPRSEAPPGGTGGIHSGAVDSVIQGYDTLSASQVVRRLEGLGASELRAVHDYESATRRRRTILHRVQQLLGTEEAPGARGPAA